MDRWIDKVAVVTGASAGIGAAISQQLVEAGINVAGLARNKERLDALSKKLDGKKGEFNGIVCDVSKEDDILNAFTWIKNNVGTIHILVNNAGTNLRTTLVDGDAKLWQQVFDTNVLGLCICTREAVQDMRANNVDGHIVHINSLSGHRIVYHSTASVYPASKYAVTALTETLRQELNSFKSKIKVTSISPGLVETELSKSSGLNSEANPSFKYQLKPEDVASAVLYTLSTPPHVQIHEIMLRHNQQPY